MIPENQFPFGCNFCILNFSSRLQRNSHTMHHFRQKHCGLCDKTVIQIGDNWYEIRLHSDDSCDPCVFTGDSDNKPDVVVIKTEEPLLLDKSLSTERMCIENAYDEVEKVMLSNVVCEYAAEESKDATNTESDPTSNSPAEDNTINLNSSSENRFSTRSIPRRHIKRGQKRETTFECKLCAEFFQGRQDFQSHADKFHDGKLHVCEICGKDFQKNSSLINHRTSHSNERAAFNCSTCNKAFKYEKILKSHMAVHRDKYKCVVCSKSFASSSNLKSHTQIVHEGKTLFQCDVCDKSFASKGNLKVHMDIHSNVRPFICNFCGQGFNAKYNLTEHMNTHTNNRPYSCQVCGKAFNQKIQLTTHTRIHTQEKKYRCKSEGCERAYINLIDLKRHLYRKHGIYTKKHVCPICSAVYPENKLLKRHLETH